MKHVVVSRPDRGPGGARLPLLVAHGPLELGELIDVLLNVDGVEGMGKNLAGPLDDAVLRKVGEVHEDAGRQTDQDDDLGAVPVPSPLLQRHAVDFAQDAVPAMYVFIPSTLLVLCKVTVSRS